MPGVEEGKELEKSSSVNLHCLKGTSVGYLIVSNVGLDEQLLGLPYYHHDYRSAFADTGPDTSDSR